MCGSPPLASLRVISVAIALIFHVPLYLILSVKDCEPDPMTPVPLVPGAPRPVFLMEKLRVIAVVSHSRKRQAVPL